MVVMNRPPTLHRYSIMTHIAIVHEGKTARLPLPVTGPYNADFDGDEMNTWAIRNDIQRIEALENSSFEKRITLLSYPESKFIEYSIGVRSPAYHGLYSGGFVDGIFCSNVN